MLYRKAQADNSEKYITDIEYNIQRPQAIENKIMKHLNKEEKGTPDIQIIKADEQLNHWT